jgi:hypothetical protein
MKRSIIVQMLDQISSPMSSEVVSTFISLMRRHGLSELEIAEVEGYFYGKLFRICELEG